MISVEQMLKDAVDDGVRQELTKLRSSLRNTCLVAPNYENPFGYVEGVEEHIDAIVFLLKPSIMSIESDKVYKRMANVLRDKNGA